MAEPYSATAAGSSRWQVLIKYLVTTKHYFCALTILLVLCGCSSNPDQADSRASGSDAEDHGTTVTNRIDVPESVRQNLGITFARVEKRFIAQTLRVPGHFEADPAGKREYRTPLAGQVTLHVKQYENVSTGTLLYELDSPDWRKVQRELADAVANVRTTSAALQTAQVRTGGSTEAASVAKRRLEADDRHDESVRDAAKVAEQRVAQLERVQRLVGGKQLELSEAKRQLAEARTVVAQAEEERAELEQQFLQLSTESSGAFGTSASLETATAARASEYEASKLNLRLAQASARSILQITDEELMQPSPLPDGSVVPYWQTVDRVQVRARAPGVIQVVEQSTGSYADATALVVSTIDPSALRFRGVALQGDLGRLSDGMPAVVVPPPGGTLDQQTSVTGTVSLAAEAHPEQRTIDVIIIPAEEELPGWARPGVAAFGEITVAGSEEEELAIPLAAVIQDDLQKVFFRRDPQDPDKVIRTEADLGINDGRWVVVSSGVRAGDEVVLDGVYELKLTGSGKANEGGHFHADGTWHAGTD